MFKNLITLVLMVLAINYNLFSQLDVSKIFVSKEINFKTTDNSSKTSKFSPMTEKLLSVLQNFNDKNEFFLNTKISKEFMLKKIVDEVYVGGLIKCTEVLNLWELERLGVKIGTRTANIYSVKIPLQSLEQVANLEGISYLQIDEKVTKKLDNVRTDIRSEQVNSGEGLPQAYRGTDVIIGIIDDGFDFTHIGLLREDASEYRLFRVWDQYRDGNHPQGFSYGNELSTTNAILNEQTDNIFESHGTHVAGIAAGSGYNTDGKYKGVAPDADLVFVSLGFTETEPYSTGQSEILDGINYIFRTAESIGKPAVVNLSLGVHIGPHDGSSLFDEACDALAGNGKIIVGSAGNEADIPLHLTHTFSPQANEVHTFAYIEPDYWGDEPATGIIDIWGETGKNFNLIVSLVDAQNGNNVSTDVVSTTENMNGTIFLTGSDNENCEIFLYVTNSDFNDKPRAFVSIATESSDLVAISLQSNEGTVHMWNHGTGVGSPFIGYSVPGFKDGDNNITVGEIGGTGKSIITVGAYCTKTSYTNLNGVLVENEHNLNALTTYSSLGPTVDGRIKPEITASGSYVISAVNSFDFLMQKGSIFDYFLAAESTIDGSRYWYYAGMEGTSMSSPVVTGVVALMLQARPDLTPFQIKNIIKATSRKDTYTGYIPPEGNNTWGYGKIDAFAALDYTVTSVAEHNKSDNNFVIYPNPASDYFFISSNSNQSIDEITITDVLGNVIYKNNNYSLFELISFENRTQNIYLLTIKNNHKIYNQRLVLIK